MLRGKRPSIVLEVKDNPSDSEISESYNPSYMGSSPQGSPGKQRRLNSFSSESESDFTGSFIMSTSKKITNIQTNGKSSNMSSFNS